MSGGRNFYGPGGPYENFAGRDATRGLACQSFDEEMLTKDLDGALDTCEDLGGDEVENLRGWIERFDEKVCLYFSLWLLDGFFFFLVGFGLLLSCAVLGRCCFPGFCVQCGIYEHRWRGMAKNIHSAIGVRSCSVDKYCGC